MPFIIVFFVLFFIIVLLVIIFHKDKNYVTGSCTQNSDCQNGYVCVENPENNNNKEAPHAKPTNPLTM
jgi:hypothetical protein